LEHRLGRSARPRRAHERDACSIGRPTRRSVVRRRRSEIADGRRVSCEDADEAVITAVGYECDAVTGRRPRRRSATSASEEELPGGRRSVDRHGPDRLAFGECNAIAAWRDHRLVALRKEFRCLNRPAVHMDRPYLHLRLYWRMVGVWRQSALGGPVGIVIAPAHIHDPLAVWRHREVRELLSVVSAIAGEGTRPEIRTFGRPDVPYPRCVDDPRDA